jgi:methyl-accepting chemotaxis protein
MNTKNLPDVISNSFVTLNSLQANIFIANRDFKLVFMNPKAEKTLKSMENDIFEVFNIRVSDFIGGSIHRFHKNPDQVERILSHPMNLPHEAIFEFGGIHLSSRINGIAGSGGDIIGYIVNWEIISEKAKLWEHLSKNNELNLGMAQLLIDLKNIENDYGKT